MTAADQVDKDMELQDIKSPLDEKAVDDKAFVVDEDYQENIKAQLPTTDDVNTPSFTFRVWLIGTLMCILLGAVNTLMIFRTQSVAITAYVAILLAYPLGKFLAAVLPTARFSLPYFGQCSLNPGPYTAKETVLIYIMASTGATGIYGIDNLFVQKHNYDLDIGAGAGLLFLVATMLSGFGIAGFAQRFLVRPAHMLWPSALPQVAMITSFHASDNTDKDPNVGENGRRHMSRLKFFGLAAFGCFLWQLIPATIAPTLSNIALLCYFSKDHIVQHLGSPIKGTGILSFTLDWNMMGSGNMVFPWWVQVNSLVNGILFFYIIVPLAWRGNWFGNPLLNKQLNTSSVFDKHGNATSALTLVDSTTHELIMEKYNAKAPFWVSPMFALAYFCQFVVFAASISHTIAWYGKDIVRRVRSARLNEDQNDIHCQLIDKYPEVPRVWYAFFFVAPAVIGILVCHFTGINMQWYLTVLAFFTTILGAIPFAMVSATTGISLYMNVIGEMIIGVINPGRPIVMMAYKCFSVTVCSAVITLLQDLKVGHYLKIAPRHVFVAQVYSQIVAVLVCYGVYAGWTSNPVHVDWILNPDKYADDPIASKWNSGQTMTVYYNASILWGAFGPIRFFFTSYLSLVIAGFVLGFVLPVLLKLGHDYIGGRVPWSLISIPVIFTPWGMNGYFSGTISGFIVAIIFQFYAYRYRNKWWKRYNLILATALDVGLAATTIFTTYALAEVNFPNWLLNPAKPTPQDYCSAVVSDQVLAALTAAGAH
ncbi:OPT superfamily [Sorochytrium milnesiophthora]